MRAVVVLLAPASVAMAAPPKKCDVAVVIDRVAKGDVTGKVTAIQPAERGVTVTLDHLDFRYISDLPAPFKVGDAIHLSYRCGGPPPGVYCDAQIADAHGRVLAIAALDGSDDFSDGWTAAPGKVVMGRQNPNETRTSVERTHALILTKGKTSVTVTAGTCTEIRDGATTWYATGSAHSWEGIRPPEGTDYRMYSLSRGK